MQKEIKTTVESIPKDSEAEKSRASQAERLLSCASELVLFHDQHKVGYAFLENDAVPLRSRKVRQWLARQLYLNEGKVPNSDALTQALTVLEAKAVFDGPEKTLFNRVAEYDEAFWYDLGKGKAVKVTSEGWDVMTAPILFRRYPHQKAQAIPVSGGNPYKVFDFLNVDEENKLLVLVYIISCFVPEIPHPIFHPNGPQGAGKTTLCRIIKRLCDPSAIEALIAPKDLNQLVQILAHHHICLFDNMSDLPGWMSDIIAQACTGGGFSKRQLYTDDEDVIYQVKRCIGLNGINLVISKPDLMDRSILLHLERIDPCRRMEEAELWGSFEEAKPKILGGVFDVLSKAIGIYPQVKLSTLPRMADFARWGYAVTEALRKDGMNFLKAYRGNIDRQNEEVVQNNTLAQAVLTLLAERESWEGTVKGAWETMSVIAAPEKTDPTFPKSARTLRKHLERIKSNLIDYGVTYRIGKKTREGYPIDFQKNENSSSLCSQDSTSSKYKSFSHDANVNQTDRVGFNSHFGSQNNPLENIEKESCEPCEPNDADFWRYKEGEI